MQAQKNAIVLLSGGVDSAACAHLLKTQGFSVTGVFVDFGQPSANLELSASRRLAELLGVAHRAVKVTSDAAIGAGEIVGRNAFLLFTALIVNPGFNGLLSLGIHAGTPYYDCSPDFLSEIGRMIAHHTDGRVTVFAPFVSWSKRDIYNYFLEIGISLDETYSCELGTDPTCGKCSSCLDREAL
jgi:7-cyano-7-deazaguanine synthase